MSSNGAGRLYRRGETWWIDFSFEGERYRESSGSTRKKDARSLLQQRMKEIADGTFAPNADDVTLGDLCELIEDDYITQDRKSLPRLKTSLRHLKEAWGEDTRALSITTARIKRYMRRRKEDGAANATINKELAALNRAFTLAEEDGLLNRSPHVPKLNVDNAREGFLTAADVDAVCEEITAPLRPVVRFAFLTGWRKGEIIPYAGRSPGLRWRQVDFEAQEVRLDPGTTKNDEARELSFKTYPQLRDLLERQRAYTDAVERERGQVVPHVFHRDGEPIKSMQAAWNGACKRAGMPDALFHDLRRSAVRNLEAAGVPRSVAMKITGHKTESVYRRYAIADKAAQEDGLAKLSDHLSGEKPERKTASLDAAREA